MKKGTTIKKEIPKKDNQYKKKLDMRPEICGDYFKMISFTYSFMTLQYGMIISRGRKFSFSL